MVPRACGLRGAVRRHPGPRARRSGDRIAIAAYLGGGDSFDRALTAFAESYADQNEKDHQALDWFAAPRFDSPSIFAALLDHDGGGYISSSRPSTPRATWKQLYYPTRPSW
jgi:hypothetical protein